MFGKFSEQIKKSAQPAASLFEMNAKTLELMSKRQTEFFSGVVGDSVKLLSTLSDQTELGDILAAQSVYAESVRERLASVSKVTYSELNGIRAEMTDLVKNSLENASEETKTAFVNAQATAISPAAKAPVTPKAPAKKAAPKKVEAKKPVVEAAPKTAAKAPVADKQIDAKKAAPKAAPKAVAKAIPKAAPKETVEAAPKAVSKAAPKATAQAAPKAVKTESQVKANPAPTAKSVAKLSPTDVKAVGKK